MHIMYYKVCFMTKQRNKPFITLWKRFISFVVVRIINIYMRERKVIRYVNIIVLDFDDYDLWKTAFVFVSSSMGTYTNFVFSCVTSNLFDRTCPYRTFDSRISDFDCCRNRDVNFAWLINRIKKEEWILCTRLKTFLKMMMWKWLILSEHFRWLNIRET